MLGAVVVRSATPAPTTQEHRDLSQVLSADGDGAPVGIDRVSPQAGQAGRNIVGPIVDGVATTINFRDRRV